MSIIIHTQYMENYGVEEGTNQWKFKWGSTYAVEGTDRRPANAVALVMQHIERVNSNLNYSMEYVHSWELSDTVHEKDTDVKDELHEVHYLDKPVLLQYNPYFGEIDNPVAPI